MRPLPDDIVEFIHRHFAANDIPRVYELLDRHEVSTPRVRRALLFLSGGSLTMLRHYVASAALDVREILLRAEYVLNVGAEPMRVRSMAEPFYPASADPESASAARERQAPAPVPSHRPKGPERTPSPRYHGHLVGLRFLLGSAEYVVSADQPNRNCVRCYRKSGNVVTIVHLPLVFVMEQLSEHIDLGSAVS